MTNSLDILHLKDTLKEPYTYKQAISGHNKKKWIISIRKEIEELKRQGTWELVDILYNRKPLRGRWVYKKKINNTNDTIKYKSRWVVQGFNQVEYLDYMETFSTVYRPETYRMVFTIVITNGWPIL